tara:strand:- start:64 stop:465 length:402 start_codon:yes stop_codon:yes gene_type:complete
MKTLVTIFFILVSLVTFPVQGLSNHETQWKVGDSILTTMLCRDEESILKIAYADTKNKEEVVKIVNKFISLESCIKLPQPAMFYINSVIVSYKDFNSKISSVLGLALFGEPKVIFGYAIAAGAGEDHKEKMSY